MHQAPTEVFICAEKNPFFLCISLNLVNFLTLRNENLFSFPSLNRNFALSLQREMKKQKPMSEEKKDIEQSTDMAAEPVGAAMRADVSTLGYDIDNWPGMPLVGPSNLEEMNARIDQAEQEINEGIGFSWEQVMSDAQSIVSRYETAVY